MYGNLLILDGDAGRTLRQRSFGQGAGEFSEHWLRDRLFEHPEILPLGEIGPEYVRSVPICREMRTEAGPIDALFVNEFGHLTILECKLWHNPEARRAVIGQVLDYARAMARLTYEDLSRQVNAALRTEGNRLFELVKARHPEIEEHVWVDEVSRNLAQGRFLLLVAGDGIREGVVGITEQLQRGVGLRFQFGLVEVAVFKDDASPLAILQPRLLTRTVLIERSVVRIETAGSPAQRDGGFSAAVLDADEEAGNDEISSETGLAAIRRKFWTDFVNDVRLEGGIDTSPKRLQQNSAKARLPLGQWITVYRLESRGRIGIWFQARGDQAVEITQAFSRARSGIVADVGLPVEWGTTEDGTVIIWAARDETDFESDSALIAQHDWLGKYVKAFTRAIGPRLREMERQLNS